MCGNREVFGTDLAHARLYSEGVATVGGFNPVTPRLVVIQAYPIGLTGFLAHCCFRALLQLKH